MRKLVKLAKFTLRSKRLSVASAMVDLKTNSNMDLYDEATGPETKALWVFGYGSLCWNPGFNFEKAVIGSIHGYTRKFWQGNTTHRGTEEQPGRVATLVENQDGVVHGVAFQISGDAAIPYLTKRECKLGGYSTEFAPFYPSSISTPFTVLVYIANIKNSLWMGEAPLLEIAKQISNSKGSSGHNIEYLLRLAEFMRNHFPNVEDDHLFTLENLVKINIEKNGMCLKTIMGDGKNFVTFRRHSNSQLVEDQQEERVDSFQFTTRVPEKTLRCLNL